MNLAIITTLGVNAGDNFIYEGFKQVFPTEWLGSTFLIDKTQIPRSKAYQEWIDASDLVVICGSPILYHECYRMHWQKKLLDYCERRRKPMLLFAIGSNFPCSLDGTLRVPNADDGYREFAHRYHALAWRPISVRDPHARAFLERLGIPDVVSLPCPSLFARPLRENPDGDWIGFIWGETYWQAPMQADEVFELCRETEKRLRTHFHGKRFMWICHDDESYRRLCKRMKKGDVIYSNNYPDYFMHYNRCAVALSTKVHGAMLLTSMGIPSVLFQLDSRVTTLHAVEESAISLETSPEELARLCIEKWESRQDFRSRIADIKERSLTAYDVYLNPGHAQNTSTEKKH